MTIWTDAMTKKYGSVEAWKEHQREIAARGGKRKVAKGFSVMDKKLARQYQSKGGKNKKKTS